MLFARSLKCVQMQVPVADRYRTPSFHLYTMPTPIVATNDVYDRISTSHAQEIR